jgi:predicted TPR repeat methyltransferase
VKQTPDAALAQPAEALRQAVALLREERLDEAAPALEAILARLPEQPDALHFLGVLRHVQGHSDEGIALIRRAIAAIPTEPGPWNNLGNVLVESQRLDEAIEAYRTSVALSKGTLASTDALNNIGTVHRKRYEWAAAEQAYRDALAVRPDFMEAWYNLSLTLMNQGRIADGLLANSKAITYSPRHLQARDQVIRALLLQGEREPAANLYREWLAEEPDNPVVQHQLAACLGEAAPERASNAYVEQVFDSFAGSFDVKLEKLHYRAPELVTEALRAAAGEPEAALDLCDAGCGTGLCGPLVRPWARHLVGCDLSVGMLKQARPRQVYDALHQAELVYYLDTQPAAFDVIVSADTLCYFGELGAAMAAAHKALRSGGWLIYTVEALPEGRTEPHVLQPTGRYAHGRGHLEQVARQAGLVWHGAQAVELRMEAGKPVHGWLVTARR